MSLMNTKEQPMINLDILRDVDPAGYADVVTSDALRGRRKAVDAIDYLYRWADKVAEITHQTRKTAPAATGGSKSPKAIRRAKNRA